MKKLLVPLVMIVALNGCSSGAAAQTTPQESLKVTMATGTATTTRDLSAELKAEYDKGYKKGFEDGVKSVKIPVTIPQTTPATTPQTKADSDIYQIKVGEVSTVFGDDGEYELTIEGVRVTKERNKFSDIKPVKVFFLDYNYKNINVDDGVWVYSSDFNVIDAEYNICDTYPVSDRSRRAQEVPPGVKSKGSEAYAIMTDSDFVIVQVVNWSGKVLGETKIQLND